MYWIRQIESDFLLLWTVIIPIIDNLYKESRISYQMLKIYSLNSINYYKEQH